VKQSVIAACTNAEFVACFEAKKKIQTNRLWKFISGLGLVDSNCRAAEKLL
jgi:hypothetical protein